MPSYECVHDVKTWVPLHTMGSEECMRVNLRIQIAVKFEGTLCILSAQFAVDNVTLGADTL